MAGTFGAAAGLVANLTNNPNSVTFGPVFDDYFESIILDSATVDARMSPTTILKPGLILANIRSTGKWTNYAATTTTLDIHKGLLVTVDEIDMLNPSATAADRGGARALGRGNLRAARLGGLDNAARALMQRQFLFDDSLSGMDYSCVREVAKTSAYTVVAADRGTMFTTAGASGSVTFTLPALSAAGNFGVFEFLALADQNMVITRAGSDVIYADGNLAATTLTFSTSSHKIGSKVRIRPNAAAGAWIVENVGGTTMTVS